MITAGQVFARFRPGFDDGVIFPTLVAGARFGRIRGRRAVQKGTRNAESVLVLDVIDRPDSHTAGYAGEHSVELAQGANHLVLLNLRKLNHVSNAGLRSIVRMSRLLQVSHGHLTICADMSELKQVVEAAGFRALIRIFETERGAVAEDST
jgi:anti-anti-sigma factor